MPTSTNASAKLATVDPVWERIRTEAEAATRADTSLGGFLFTSVLNPSSFEEALCHRLAQRLGNADIGAELIVQGFEDALEMDPDIGAAARADRRGTDVRVGIAGDVENGHRSADTDEPA